MYSTTHHSTSLIHALKPTNTCYNYFWWDSVWHPPTGTWLWIDTAYLTFYCRHPPTGIIGHCIGHSIGHCSGHSTHWYVTVNRHCISDILLVTRAHILCHLMRCDLPKCVLSRLIKAMLYRILFVFCCLQWLFFVNSFFIIIPFATQLDYIIDTILHRYYGV